MKRAIYLLPMTLLFFSVELITAEQQSQSSNDSPSYAVVVSKATASDVAWKKVVDALVKKHNAKVYVYQKSIDETLKKLKSQFPRYVCFVATSKEANQKYVAQVHKLTRRFDDDPYTDALWGILTGFNAQNALDIAQHKKPLVIRKVASGTNIALEMCHEGIWYCELKKHRKVVKSSGGKPIEEKGPADTTKSLADTLTKYQADLFVTSGHATQRNWQIGFRYRNGYFFSKAGQLYGRDTKGKEFKINSSNPKVYMPIGNCLMGNIDGPDAMALAYMNSVGVHQMIGYTVPTWFGYGGWGCLDYFIEQPGRFTFTEAFFANHQALLHRLETEFPEATKESGRNVRGDARGLLFDRDVVAFYGDPAWQAKMAANRCAWKQTLIEKDGVYTFTITPQRGKKTFQPINTNGSQRGYRPIVIFFPHRLKEIEIIAGKNFKPLITDNFLLFPNPRKCDPETKYQIIFKAKKQ